MSDELGYICWYGKRGDEHLGKCSSQKFCYKDSSRVPDRNIWDPVRFLDGYIDRRKYK
jgi:hypothetical protein